MQLSLSLRSNACVARPTTSRIQQIQQSPRLVVVVRSGAHPTQADIDNLNSKVKEAIKEADETCNGGDAKHCAAAWDNVEELSAAAAHKKVAFQDDKVASDPLEQFCDDNPDADECRVYED